MNLFEPSFAQRDGEASQGKLFFVLILGAAKVNRSTDHQCFVQIAQLCLRSLTELPKENADQFLKGLGVTEDLRLVE